jgi:hypothetical protein
LTFGIIYLFSHPRQKYEKEPYTGGGGGHKIADWGARKRAGGHVLPVYMLNEALFISANNMLLALMK